MLNGIIRLAPKRHTDVGREKSETKKKSMNFHIPENANIGHKEQCNGSNSAATSFSNQARVLSMSYSKSQFRGHKKIETTLLYMQLADVIFKNTSEEFTVRVAKTTEEITELLEVGFEHICEKDGLVYFRKRK